MVSFRLTKEECDERDSQPDWFLPLWYKRIAKKRIEEIRLKQMCKKEREEIRLVYKQTVPRRVLWYEKQISIVTGKIRLLEKFRDMYIEQGKVAQAKEFTLFIDKRTRWLLRLLRAHDKAMQELYSRIGGGM